MYSLLFLNPGHFHAALTLREKHRLVRDEIFIYAERGPDVEAFLALVESFNTRAEGATAWKPQVYTGPDHLQRLIAERRGEVVVIAGKNDSKIASIAALHEAGFHVLADKPWLVGVEGLEALGRAGSGEPLVMDIMTGRFEITHILPKRLTEQERIFGAFRPGEGGGPAVSMESVHHLYKTVNGVPLVRPAWYFDARVQGDGIVDIPSHLVDKVLWMMGDGPWDYDRDIELQGARLWDTVVSGEAFSKIAKVPAFPDFLAGRVVDGALRYACNGEFAFKLRGVPVRLGAEWRLEAPPAGGDTYQFLIHGGRADIAVEMGPQTDFQPKVFVRPQAGEEGVGPALQEALAGWRGEFPGLTAVPAPGGYEVVIPKELRTSHEEHFALVLDEFLGYLEKGVRPEHLPGTLRAKYTLTARASELARKDAPP